MGKSDPVYLLREGMSAKIPGPVSDGAGIGNQHPKSTAPAPLPPGQELKPLHAKHRIVTELDLCPQAPALRTLGDPDLEVPSPLEMRDGLPGQGCKRIRWAHLQHLSPFFLPRQWHGWAR